MAQHKPGARMHSNTGKTDIPMAYISKKVFFMNRPFLCSPKTLIPRRDTEVLVKKSLQLLSQIKQKPTVIEIGTGTGNIAVSLALHNKQVDIYASDISKDAVSVAKKNISKYKLQQRINLCIGDMFTPFKNNGVKKVDMIICNPPYIPINKIQTLSKQVTDHEPLVALKAGPFGMAIIKKLISQSPTYLKQGGYLLFEFGEKQDRLVERLLKRNGCYTNIQFYKYNGVKRFVSAQYICE